MKVFPLNRWHSLIRIGARVHGRAGHSDLKMVLDTGAVVTLITPDVLAQLGYGPEDGYQKTTITSPLGKERGYLLRVREFRCLGQTFHDYPIHAYSLADTSGIDGLLGLDFLDRFNYEVRPRQGVIRIEPA
jgi:hypothetical protein